MSSCTEIDDDHYGCVSDLVTPLSSDSKLKRRVKHPALNLLSVSTPEEVAKLIEHTTTSPLFEQDVERELDRFQGTPISLRSRDAQEALNAWQSRMPVYRHNPYQKTYIVTKEVLEETRHRIETKGKKVKPIEEIEKEQEELRKAALARTLADDKKEVKKLGGGRYLF